MMEDLITDLRNKTALGRFTRGEVGEILSYLETGGYLKDPRRLIEPKAPEPLIEPEGADEVPADDDGFTDHDFHRP